MSALIVFTVLAINGAFSDINKKFGDGLAKYFADFGIIIIFFMAFLIKNSSINDDLFAQIS